MKAAMLRMMAALAACLFLAVACSSADDAPRPGEDKSGPPTGLIPLVQPQEAPEKPAGEAAPAPEAAVKTQSPPEERTQHPAEERPKSAGPTPLDGSRQIVLVLTPSWKDFKGRMLRLSRPAPGTPWSVLEGFWPCVVGKNGLAWGKGVYPAKPEDPAKREGDGRSPAGVFRLTEVFGSEPPRLAKTLGLKMPYLRLEQTSVCVNDTASGSFNKIVDPAKMAKQDFKRFERMQRPDKANRWGILLEHNPPPVSPEAGSCVFINIWGGPGVPSGGSTGLAEPDMRELITWLDPAAKPLFVQLPAPELSRLREAWRLPSGIVP